jgi:hypothetical protein
VGVVELAMSDYEWWDNCGIVRRFKGWMRDGMVALSYQCLMVASPIDVTTLKIVHCDGKWFAVVKTVVEGGI